ncbi:MAG: AAA family ATPase [Crenarchaeota archaeon]|nr:AAA family ATPase [Thermoproteota archaeon]
MRIIITGTPGTGKTTVSKIIARELNHDYVNLNEELVKRGVCRYNEKLDTHEIVNREEAEKIADEVLDRSNIIVDTIALSIIDPDKVDIVVVLRLHPLELFRRLRCDKQWRGMKLCSNVMAEVLDYFLIEAIECFGETKIAEIDTTGKSVEEVVRECLDVIHGKRDRRIGIVSWLSALDPDVLVRLDLCARGELDDDSVLVVC